MHATNEGGDLNVAKKMKPGKGGKGGKAKKPCYAA